MVRTFATSRRSHRCGAANRRFWGDRRPCLPLSKGHLQLGRGIGIELMDGWTELEEENNNDNIPRPVLSNSNHSLGCRPQSAPPFYHDRTIPPDFVPSPIVPLCPPILADESRLQIAKPVNINFDHLAQTATNGQQQQMNMDKRTCPVRGLIQLRMEGSVRNCGSFTWRT